MGLDELVRGRRGPPSLGRVKETLAQLKKNTFVAHLLRTLARYGNRLGAQFAAAATYFSVLAVVPVLMLAFAALGMTLTWLHPEMLVSLKDAVTDQFSREPETGRKIGDLIDEALHNWTGIGVFGVLSLAYAGAGWVANLKTAIRAMWRPEFDRTERKRNIVLEVLVNLGHLVVIMLLVGVVVSAATFSAAANGMVQRWLHLEGVPGMGLLTWLGGALLAILGGWLLGLYLLRKMPEPGKPRWKPLVQGAAVMAVGLYGLQALAGMLITMFAKNKAAAVFGPVIVVMLIINLFMQLLLYVAAWVATENQPAIAGEYNEADEPLRSRRAEDLDMADGHWAAADHDRELKERGEKSEKVLHLANPNLAWAREQRRRGVIGPEPAAVDPRAVVSTTAAAKGVRAGMAGGWALGAATGVGLGALFTSLLRLFRRR